MAEVIFDLAGGHRMIIRDAGAGDGVRLDRLAALTGARIAGTADAVPPEMEVLADTGGEPAGEVPLLQWKCGRFSYVPESKTFRFRLNPERRELPAKVLAPLWRLLVLGACYAGILRGLPVLPMHGAVLQVRQGGLLLCGPSGIGKSTVAGRWSAAGGGVLCDDMTLVTAAPAGLTVRPLPTWSRCLTDLTDGAADFRRELPVQAVFSLKRSTDGRERQEPMDWAAGYADIYSACCFFLLPLIRKLPDREQGLLRTAAAGMADRLAASPLVWYADMQGGLEPIMAEYR